MGMMMKGVVRILCGDNARMDFDVELSECESDEQYEFEGGNIYDDTDT